MVEEKKVLVVEEETPNLTEAIEKVEAEDRMILDANGNGDTEGIGVTEKKMVPEETFFIQRKDKSVEAINIRRRFITKICTELQISRKQFKKWYKDKRDTSFKREVEVQYKRFTSELG
jgi:hypothetical protein